MDIDLSLQHLPVPPRRKDYRIGAIGAGFIMRDIHLVAYKNAGFNVVAISARDIDQARATAELRAIPKVYDTWQELLADDRIEVLDIAVPPAGGRIFVFGEDERYDVVTALMITRVTVDREPATSNHSE